MKGVRATVAEKESRINKVYGMLLNGASRAQVVQFTTEWGLTIRQIDTYIAEANQLIEAEGKVSRSRELGRAVGRLNNIYARSVAVQDYQRAIAAQKELNMIFGLYAPKPDVHILAEVDHVLLQKVTGLLRQEGMGINNLLLSVIDELEKEKTQGGEQPHADA